MIKLAATVTFYNPDVETINNISSYINNVEKLYIIDNSSFSNENIIPKNDKIIYICNYKNIGVAAALNLGAKLAISDGFKWLLTMDQDSFFSFDNLIKMINYLNKVNNKDKIGLLSPFHVTKTGTLKSKKVVEDVIEVMTSGNIINLDAFIKIGGYKSWLFIDGVDFDFCMNLNIHGYKVRRLNFCNLIHELGDIKLINFFGRKLVCSNHNYIRRYYMSRNDHYIFDLYSKYFPDYCQMIIDGLKGQARNILFFENNKFKKLVFMKYGFQDYKNNVRGECKWK